MARKPHISIITINKNNLEGLKKTIKSVIGQTWKNFEFIVVDGGSTDGSKEYLQKNDLKIDHWVSETDKGVYHGMNKGIKLAKGEYLLFLNSGDHFFTNQVLAENYEFFKDYDLIYFNLKMIGENQEFIANYPSKLRFSHFVEDTLPHPSTFIKSELFKLVGFYDEKLSIVSDWKFFLNSVCKYNCTYLKINSILSIYYLDGISSKSENSDLVASERKKVLYQSFPNFMDDYLELVGKRRILNSSRFKKFCQLEEYAISRKVISWMFRIMLRNK